MHIKLISLFISLFLCNLSAFNFESKDRELSNYEKKFLKERAEDYLESFTESHDKLSEVKLFLLEIKAAMQIKLEAKFTYYEELRKLGKSLPEDIYVFAYRMVQEIDLSLLYLDELKKGYGPVKMISTFKKSEDTSASFYLARHMRNVSSLMRFQRQIVNTLDSIYDYSERFDFGYHSMLGDNYYKREMRKADVEWLLNFYVMMAEIPEVFSLLSSEKSSKQD